MNDLEKTISDLSKKYERTWIQKVLRQAPDKVELTELEQMGYGLYRPVATSWPHMGQIIVIMRELSDVQIFSLGEISMIKTFWDKIENDREPSIEEMNAYAERHDNILRLSMANPTYDDVISMAGSYINHESIKKELKEIKKIWLELPQSAEKVRLKKQYDGIEIASKFILPPQFTAPLVSWVSGVSRTEIESVTYEALLRAATLAKLGGDNPSDHISGKFERFPGDKLLYNDINNRAWYYLQNKDKFDARKI
jgi:hypothetical protein